MKFMKILKIILIVLILIILLPVILIGIIFTMILSLFLGKEYEVSDVFKKIVKRVEQDLIDEVIIDDVREELTPAEVEKLLIENMIDYLLKEKFELKLSDYDLEKIKKNLVKEVPKEHKVGKYTLNKFKEVMYIYLNDELIKEKIIDEPSVSLDEKKEDIVVDNISFEKEEKVLVQKTVVLNTKKEKEIKEILSSYKYIEEEVKEEILDITIDKIVKYKAVDVVIEILNEKKNVKEEIKDIEFLEEEIEKIENLENETKKKVDEKKEEEKVNYIKFNVHKMDDMLLVMHNIEKDKEDVENRDYDNVTDNIDKEIVRIENLLLINNLDIKTLDELNNYKDSLYNLRDHNEEKKVKDYNDFKDDLYTDVSKDDEKKHIEVLNEVDIKNKELLDEYSLEKVEDIIKLEKSKVIEKELIFKQLSKIERSNNIFNRITRYIKSKIFKNYSENKVIKKNLNFLDNIVVGKTDNYVDNYYPTKHKQIMEEDLIICEENKMGLFNINNKIVTKHPELSKDINYRLKIKNVSNILNDNHEKSFKKNNLKEKVLQRKPRVRVREKI